MSTIPVHFDNRLYINKILIEGLRQLVCENISSGTSSPNMVVDRLTKITPVEQVVPIRRQLV